MTGAQDKAREPERCHICGAEMSAENPEICKNFHVQRAQHPAQGKIIYSSVPWKIYEQDAGMGERDYAVMLNDIFFCRTEYSQTAHKIIIAVNRPHTPAPEHSVSLTAIEIALRREDCPSENVQWAIEHLNQYQERQETASPHPPAPTTYEDAHLAGYHNGYVEGFCIGKAQCETHHQDKCPRGFP